MKVGQYLLVTLATALLASGGSAFAQETPAGQMRSAQAQMPMMSPCPNIGMGPLMIMPGTTGQVMGPGMMMGSGMGSLGPGMMEPGMMGAAGPGTITEHGSGMGPMMR